MASGALNSMIPAPLGWCARPAKLQWSGGGGKTVSVPTMIDRTLQTDTRNVPVVRSMIYHHCPLPCVPSPETSRRLCGEAPPLPFL